MAKSSIKTVSCCNCGIEFTRRINLANKRNYCSMGCKRLDKNSYKSEWTDERRAQYSAMLSGANNPNFGNKWTEEQKAHLSEFKINQYKENPTLAYEVGKSNRGVKFTQERIDAMHSHRTSESYSRPHSDERKIEIGIKSKEKWTDEFKVKYRKTMEELGYWRPLSDTDEYEIYYRDCNWKDSMIQYFNQSSLIMLKEFGFFNKNNPSGYVRDHIVPRKIGYEFGLPPIILRHPANLQFISHKENVSKGFKDRRLTDKEKDTIINELFNKIMSFQSSWKEQDACVTFITERRLSDA